MFSDLPEAAPPMIARVAIWTLFVGPQSLSFLHYTVRPPTSSIKLSQQYELGQLKVFTFLHMSADDYENHASI